MFCSWGIAQMILMLVMIMSVAILLMKTGAWEMMVVVMVVIIVMILMMVMIVMTMVLMCWCDDEDRSRCAAGVEDESQTFNQAKPRAPQSYSLTVYTYTEGPKVLQCKLILGAPKSYPMHTTQSSRTAHLHNDHCKCTLSTLFTIMI